ncbi:MAG: DedA family protein [Acidobacteria bacterium]|nr:DedA family protein [Acidobacteriota bacterium]MBI3657380.1 DedA family protein [Acidobacteriota bacterium]
MEYYIRTYGYLGIVIWTFLGGEEGVIVAGILAREGYLNITGVIVASALGGALGDQIYFYLARGHGARLLKKSDRMAKAYPRAERLVQQYGALVVLLSRFMIGLRITIPVVCGTFRMRAVTYSSLNLLSAALWASLFGMMAFFFGRAVWDRVRSLPRFGVLGLVLILTISTLTLFFNRRRRRRSQGFLRTGIRGDGDE